MGKTGGARGGREGGREGDDYLPSTDDRIYTFFNSTFTSDFLF